MITKLEIGWFQELPEEILDYEPFLNLTDNVKSDKINEKLNLPINDFSL